MGEPVVPGAGRGWGAKTDGRKRRPAEGACVGWFLMVGFLVGTLVGDLTAGFLVGGLVGDLVGTLVGGLVFNMIGEMMAGLKPMGVNTRDGAFVGGLVLRKITVGLNSRTPIGGERERSTPASSVSSKSAPSWRLNPRIFAAVGLKRRRAERMVITTQR